MPVFKKTTFNFYHMKKIIIAVLCLSMGWAAAQKKKTGASNKSNRVSSPQKSYSKNQPLTFGIKAGGGLNKISVKDETYRNLKSKIGFYGGLFVNYSISEKMAVQLDALYQHFGTKINYKDDTNVKGVKGYWTLSHINIPVTFQFKFIPQVYIETGPEVNIPIKSEQVNTDKAGYNNIPDKTSFKEYTKGAFFGWNFGGGYFITEKFSVNLRYSMGITSPYNEKEDHNGKKDRAKFRTGNLQLGLSYHF